MDDLNILDVLEFIEVCQPSFEYSKNREQHGMFTVLTQYVYADDVESLLKKGIETYEAHLMAQYKKDMVDQFKKSLDKN